VLLKSICLAAALSAAAVSSSQGATFAAPVQGDSTIGENIYGFIVNTDLGTFDGVALAQAVRTSAEAAFLVSQANASAVRFRRSAR
jgi:hypothetical protein